jgi:AraC-like DNA-binding protein
MGGGELDETEIQVLAGSPLSRVRNVSQKRSETACPLGDDSETVFGVETLPPVVSQQVLDPEALAAAIRNTDFQPCQLSVRPSPSWIARVMCENVCLDFASLGPAMLFSGSMPQDCYTLVFVTECPEKGRSFNFALEHNDGYMGFFPPGGMLDAYTPEGYANATLTVTSAVFLSAVERLFPEMPEGVLKRGAGMRIGADEQVRMRGLLAAVMAGIEDRAEPLVGSEVRKNLEGELLDVFLGALRSGCGALVPNPGRRFEGRLRRLRQARDYLADRLHEPVSVADLCGELGLSRRGVELLFQDSLGIGPNAFLRHQRLHGVRRALRAASPEPGLVKESALQWGFWHMGHFSREYRSLFGESPSMTLSRQTHA